MYLRILTGFQLLVLAVRPKAPWKPRTSKLVLLTLAFMTVMIDTNN